jgi:acetyltransferase-like isoleucine patch superfamily enzyme
VSVLDKLRRGEGPFWGRMKRFARAVLNFHLPVSGPTRPLFSFLYRVHVAGRESLVWALRFFWYEPLFRSRCAAVGSGFRMELLPYMGGRGRIVIGDNVFISGKISIGFASGHADEPEFVVGDRTFIGHRCGFNVARSVRVGRHCYIASGVSVVDMDGHPIDAAERRSGKPTPPEGVGPVVIGDDVWIGFHAVILKGVTVGDRSVVAAGAVVTRDVPPDCVVAGNPARVVKQLAPGAEAGGA